MTAPPAGSVDSAPLTRAQRRCVALLVALGGALCLLGALERRMLSEHECLVAETAAEMRASGDWTVPRFATTPRIRKTPLGYWAVALSSMLTGRVDELTARLPSALAGLGTLVCIFWTARRLFGRRVGVVTLWVALSAVAVRLYAPMAVVEMQLTFWCAACYACFVEAEQRRGTPAGRAWAYAFYALFGAALMAKFPMGGVVVGAPIGVYALLMLARRRWTFADLHRLRIWDGALLTLLICVPWPVCVARVVPHMLWQWKTEILDRFSGELRGTGRSAAGPIFYAGVLLALALPWSLSVPAALALPFRRANAERRDGLLLVWCWLVVSVGVLAAAAVQRAHYAVPSMPALLILLGVAVDDLFLGPSLSPRRTAAGSVAAGAIGAALLAAAAILADRAQLAPRGWILSGALGAAGAVALAAIAFWRGRRALSLATLGALSLAGLTLVRPLLPPRGDERPALRAFAKRVESLVPRDEALCWFGRPVAPAVFYGGGRLVAPRIDEPASLLKQTGGDMPGPSEWQLLAATALTERLAQPRPVWVVLRREQLLLLRGALHVPGSVALAMEPAGVESPLVLITNVAAGEPIERFDRDGPREPRGSAPR
ncbi:MAG: glycosyltransferase family 39 protein [Phycisphaerae bacterium]